ncbi:MAG: DAK2 domain-containing protein, partial [Deltaproteobacteria bacterium]|nr:DAK2 domain-containing protein [Candidatus Anaeroferrophillacea bacterium]
MKEIDAAKFKQIVRHGMEHLFRDRETLNRINVFPVADGDTGDNLVHTLKPVYDGMDDWQETRLDETADRLARAMLLSAKGNSGVIFSQFFFAFAQAMRGQETIGPADFSLAMEKAVCETYAAVADPREGTILTVLRHTAE